MSKLVSYIKSNEFDKQAFAFFLGYTFVAFALHSQIMFFVGVLGIFWFYFAIIGGIKK